MAAGVETTELTKELQESKAADKPTQNHNDDVIDLLLLLGLFVSVGVLCVFLNAIL